MSEQIKTVPVTWKEIMRKPEFAMGVADMRACKRYRHDYDCWDTNTQWNYERGRLFGRLAPRDMTLKSGRQINPKAIRLAERLSMEDAII
jgi:hypothetical protein